MNAAPQSNMPPAARRQAAEANRLIAQLNAKPGDPPLADPLADPAAAAARPAPAPDEFPSVDIAPVMHADAPASTPAPVNPVPPPDDNFKAKFNTLRGKYNAETSRFREQLEEQQRTINQLVMRQATPAPAPAVPMRPEDRFDSMGVSKKEVEEYGPELLGMIARVAEGTVTPELKQLMKDTAELKHTLALTQQSAAAMARKAVYDSLDAAVPTWRAVNEDDNFLAWLQESDVFSGTSRNASLVGAFNSNDVARVVGIFQAYVGKTPIPTPRPTATVDRGTLVAPGTPRGGAMEAPDGNRGTILSEQEIGEFYARVRRKQVTPEEYKAKSAAIALAVAEGRVKPTRNDIHQNS